MLLKENPHLKELFLLFFSNKLFLGYFMVLCPFKELLATTTTHCSSSLTRSTVWLEIPQKMLRHSMRIFNKNQMNEREPSHRRRASWPVMTGVNRCRVTQTPDTYQVVSLRNPDDIMQFFKSKFDFWKSGLRLKFFFKKKYRLTFHLNIFFLTMKLMKCFFFEKKNWKLF